MSQMEWVLQKLRELEQQLANKNNKYKTGKQLTNDMQKKWRLP